MISLRIEEAALNAWPALNSLLYDGWLLRFARGYTKRANSINPIFPGTLALESKVDYCEAIYQQQNLQPVFRLTTLTDKQKLDNLLLARGYELIDRTKVQACDLNIVAAESSPQTVIWDNQEGLRSWLDVFHKLNPQRVDAMTHEKMLRRIMSPAAPMVMWDDNEIVACGLGVVEDEYLGLFDIATGSNHRRKGYARTLTGSLLAWGHDLGARYAYLQVMESNKAAIQLYQRLGFQDVYHYWYRVKH
ncbi:MAG: GNAT family N-acetyltransferase [Candidatus Promineifilaceae bacterium]|nr:GNAT family N-acetyltransferase [Candidatus Promineifilaceae bacterium]